MGNRLRITTAPNKGIHVYLDDVEIKEARGMELTAHAADVVRFTVTIFPETVDVDATVFTNTVGGEDGRLLDYIADENLIEGFTNVEEDVYDIQCQLDPDDAVQNSGDLEKVTILKRRALRELLRRASRIKS